VAVLESGGGHPLKEDVMQICTQHPDRLWPHFLSYGENGEDCPGPGVDAWAWIKRAEGDDGGTV
jgi:hypothetical protein